MDTLTVLRFPTAEGVNVGIKWAKFVQLCGRISVHILSSSCCPNGLTSQESHCFFRHSVSSVRPNNCTETVHGISTFTAHGTRRLEIRGRMVRKFSPLLAEKRPKERTKYQVEHFSRTAPCVFPCGLIQVKREMHSV
jgi:hypothetical protein